MLTLEQKFQIVVIVLPYVVMFYLLVDRMGRRKPE